MRNSRTICAYVLTIALHSIHLVYVPKQLTVDFVEKLWLPLQRIGGNSPVSAIWVLTLFVSWFLSTSVQVMSKTRLHSLAKSCISVFQDGNCCIKKLKVTLNEFWKSKHVSGGKQFCGKRDLALWKICLVRSALSQVSRGNFPEILTSVQCLGLIFQLSWIAFVQQHFSSHAPCPCSSVDSARHSAWPQLLLPCAASGSQLPNQSAPLWQWCLGKSRAKDEQWWLLKKQKHNSDFPSSFVTLF